MRRVDNVVSVLDSALQRHAQSAIAPATRSSITDSLPTKAPNSLHTQKGATKVTPEELSTTAKGQRMLNTEVNAELNDRRHGRGPRQGEILSGSLPSGQVKMLGDEARSNGTIKLIERWKAEMPTEAEMLPRDKYTMFDRKAKHYRKGVHSKKLIRKLDFIYSNMLTHSTHRAPEMDQSVPKTEPPGFLKASTPYLVFIIRMHWRYGWIYGIRDASEAVHISLLKHSDARCFMTPPSAHHLSTSPYNEIFSLTHAI